MDKQYFDNNDDRFCIYGLTTGHCSSKRAKELYKICTEYSTKGVNSNIPILGVKGSEVFINVRTPLESYVFLFEESGEKIIDFIKGETKTLEL